MQIETITSETNCLEENEDQCTKHKCSIVCPSYEFLINAKISTNVVCTVPNCGEIFSQESALSLHLEKAHKIVQKVSVFFIIIIMSLLILCVDVVLN